jgi:hypothetical protein
VPTPSRRPRASPIDSTELVTTQLDARLLEPARAFKSTVKAARWIEGVEGSASFKLESGPWAENLKTLRPSSDGRQDILGLQALTAVTRRRSGHGNRSNEPDAPWRFRAARVNLASTPVSHEIRNLASHMEQALGKDPAFGRSVTSVCVWTFTSPTWRRCRHTAIFLPGSRIAGVPAAWISTP